MHCQLNCSPRAFCSHRDLGDHGFLVEGSLTTTRTKAVAESIPYKYVIYRLKKCMYEYEYIYKLDSTTTTNRCLFVKPLLVSDDGMLMFNYFWLNEMTSDFIL